MAKYEIGDLVGPNYADDLLTKLATFLTANGWTIDYQGTYNARVRIHVHLGDSHFDFYASTATNINYYGCRGYTVGANPNVQPTTTAANTIGTSATYTQYVFGTFGEIVFIRLRAALGPASAFNLCNFGNITGKIGNWNGGQILDSSQTSFLANNGHVSSFTNPYYYRHYYEGAWITTAVNGCLSSNLGNTQTFYTKLPSNHNLSSPLLPIVMFIYDSTYHRAAAIIPDVYYYHNYIHEDLDILTVGADQFLYVKFPDLEEGSNNPSFVFKI